MEAGRKIRGCGQEVTPSSTSPSPPPSSASTTTSSSYTSSFSSSTSLPQTYTHRLIKTSFETRTLTLSSLFPLADSWCTPKCCPRVSSGVEMNRPASQRATLLGAKLMGGTPDTAISHGVSLSNARMGGGGEDDRRRRRRRTGRALGEGTLVIHNLYPANSEVLNGLTHHMKRDVTSVCVGKRE